MTLLAAAGLRIKNGVRVQNADPVQVNRYGHGLRRQQLVGFRRSG